MDDLVEACSEALYEMECITGGVSVRTVQADIQVMRSDKLGYNAPIEVSDYSITESPIIEETYELVAKAIRMIHQKGDASIEDMGDILEQVGERLKILLIYQ